MKTKPTFPAFQGSNFPSPIIGSLVFIKGKGILPWLIRLWTRRGALDTINEFNHVAICVGPDIWLSAEPGGVKARNLARLTRNSAIALIMIYEGLDRVGFVAAQSACKAASGKEYDFLGCLGFIMNRLFGFQISSRANWFCSELCIFAWQEAMATLGIPHTRREPTDTTPNDLYRWTKENGFRVLYL